MISFYLPNVKMTTSHINEQKDERYGYVIDKFIANRIESSFITSQKITSERLKINALRMHGNIREVHPTTPNFDFSQIETNYSDIWRPQWSTHNKAFLLDGQESGMTLSNGKIALISSFDHIDVQKCYLLRHSNALDQDAGNIFSNIIEPFYPFKLTCFHIDPKDIYTFTMQQIMDMKHAILKSKYKLVDKARGAFVHADVDLLTPRHLPFATMQTITLHTPSTIETSLPFFHEVYAYNNLKNVSFNNNIIHNQSKPSESVYVLSGQGFTHENKAVAFATIYVIDMPETIENRGFNLRRDVSTSSCYNTFYVHFNASGDTRKIHIFTTMMSETDFIHPLEQVKKMVMSIYMGDIHPRASLQRVRTQHILVWENMWKTNMTITPKANANDSEKQNVHRYNRVIKTCLYNIFACARDKTFSHTHVLPVVDPTGHLFFHGDLWLFPTMLFLKPDIMKGILEHRFQFLDMAQQHASTYGYSGAKFPFISELDMHNNILFHLQSPLAVINNGFIVINTWNYYRISFDKEWLMHRGYPIMRKIIDFFTDIVEFDQDEKGYTIKNVTDLSGRESRKNNTLLNNVVKLSFAYFIEASYEIQAYIKDIWLDIYYTLPILFVTDEKAVIQHDIDSVPEDTYKLLEVLLILRPYFNHAYLDTKDFMGYFHKTESIKKNIDFYENKRQAGLENHPFNLGILALLYVIYAQYDENAITQFVFYMEKFLDLYVKGIWGHVKDFHSPLPSNSLHMNGLMLMILLEGVFEMNIVGGVAETRFYYEEMRIKFRESRNMPRHWSDIKLTHFGSDHTTSIVRNKILYIAQTQQPRKK